MRRGSLLGLVVVALCLGLPSVAQAAFGLVPGSVKVAMLDSAGQLEVRAGSHPDRFTVDFAFNQSPDGSVDGNLKDLELALPQGLVGDPHAVAECQRESLSTMNNNLCQPDAQVGQVSVTVDLGVPGFGITIAFPVFNVEPRPGNLAEFGVDAGFANISMAIRAGSDGRNLVLLMTNSTQYVPMRAFKVELWGVPADHLSGAALPRRPFITAPTRCDIPPVITLSVRSWQDPGRWLDTHAGLPQLTGCEGLSFGPRVDFELAGGAADTPTGAEFDLLLPQNDDPDGLSVDRIRDVDLVLPEGMALSPSALSGLPVCAEAVGRGEAGPAGCPALSRIGTVEASSPLLDEPASGGVYIGEQLPGNDFRLFAGVSVSGVDVRLPLTLHADPETGRLSTRLEGLPPLPFDRMTLRFAGGARAPLVSPLGCGPAVVSATFTPYGGGAPVVSSDAAMVSTAPSGGACPGVAPFAPTVEAGAVRARARASSPFVATIRRRDGEQSLGRFSMTLPPGMSAGLGAAGRCGGAALVAVTCPSGSRVGSVVTEIGSGAHPVPIRGDVFLTGPYRSKRLQATAPFGLAIVFRAVVGPFDLGTIVVRAALRLDPVTGQVVIDSDALPRTVKGIPLQMQTLAIDVDRRGFIVNPTSCKPSRVTTTIDSTGGAVAHPSSRFAVGGCRDLAFRPSLSMALTDRPELHAGGHPGVRLRVRSTTRGANIRQATVAMPKLLGASPTGPAAICSLEQARDERCPAAARIGSASGRTPLLSSALRGTVYMVQPSRGILPEVWAQMQGMGVSLRFRMQVVLGKDGQLHGKLVDLPDLPLSTFTMSFKGGKRGLFTINANPCKGGRAKRMTAKARLTGHNDATRSLTRRVTITPGC